ncbi:MAG: glycosyltransferase family 2 protein [Candidatus Methanomethylophilaceae archaeon]|nr:glycosyltransferase family 2 protein [Candidatus Methanomethylophilaceae archaeon]
MNQTLLPAEVIVADSGLNADISRRVKEISDCAAGLANVKYVVIRDVHAGNERNIAATHCTRKWIAFLDDDDEWYPEKVAKQMSSIPAGASMVVSAYDIEDEGKVTSFHPKKDLVESSTAILGENVLGCTSMQVVSKKAFDEVGGFDPRFRANQEWDLWIRLHSKGSYHLVDEVVGRKHVGKNTISSNPVRRMKGWGDMIRYHFKEYMGHPDQFARVMWFVTMDNVRFRHWIRAVLSFSFYCALSAASKVVKAVSSRRRHRFCSLVVEIRHLGELLLEALDGRHGLRVDAALLRHPHGQVVA